MHILIMARPDGTMFTRTPAQNPRDGVGSELDARRKDGSWEKTVERLAKQNPRGAKLVTTMDHLDLPEGHQHFKSARRWHKTEKRVYVDMDEARTLKTGQLRLLRDERLKELDIEFMKAAEMSDDRKLAAVAGRKQQLRDLPVTVQADLDKIKNPVQLHHFEPEWA